MKIYTNEIAMMNMTREGRSEIEADKDFDKFKPIMSSTERAIMSMTDTGCREIMMFENYHPCQRTE